MKYKEFDKERRVMRAQRQESVAEKEKEERGREVRSTTAGGLLFLYLRIFG